MCVVFSDESRFEVRGTDKHKRVWRSNGEKGLPECLEPTFKSGRESVMVWGGMCAHGRTLLVLAEGNMNTALYAEMFLTTVYPEIMRLFGSPEAMLFQEDLAQPHTDQASRQVRPQLGIRCPHCSPQSPDANCIENAWDYLERQVRTTLPAPKNKEELFDALKHAWYCIPQSYFASLVASMPRNAADIVKGRGFPTKY